MDAAVIAETDDFSIVAVAYVVEVPDLQRQLLHRETWYQHLHRRRVWDGLDGVSARAAEQCLERHRRCQQPLLNGLALLIGESAIINENLRDRSVEKSLGVGRLRAVVRVNAGADHHLIQANHRLQPIALAALEAVQKNLGSPFGYPRTDGENMEATEGPL